ncbi:MAG TPA: PorP/SprF family type IX secretion system membrane protein [Bacteroidia bacterium]|jgi:type IX secretion system PorP/SprF family membrane protein
MKKVLYILLLTASTQLFAQDPTSSHFSLNSLNLNPALTGINMNARVGVNYRNQWAGIPGKFETYNCWADIYNPAFNGGLGLLAIQDISGEGFFKTTTIGLFQSYEKTVPRIIRIRAGYNVTVVNKSIDWSKLVFSDQLDATHGEIYASNIDRAYPQKTFVDFSAGMMLDFKMIKRGRSIITNSVGYATAHLTQPNESFSGTPEQRLPRKHRLHYTMTIEVKNTEEAKSKSSFFISPNIIYERQGLGSGKGVAPYKNEAQFSTLNVGLYAMKQPMMAGLFYRKKHAGGFKDNDALICFLGLKFNPRKTTSMKFGYSYDVTVSKLATNSMGSHELSLTFEFLDAKLGRKNAAMKKRRKKEIECEDFGTRSFVF